MKYVVKLEVGKEVYLLFPDGKEKTIKGISFLANEVEDEVSVKIDDSTYYLKIGKIIEVSRLEIIMELALYEEVRKEALDFAKGDQKKDPYDPVDEFNRIKKFKNH